jgi:ATP-binding cassette subfamily F protein 3
MLEKVDRIELEAGPRHIHFKFPQPPRTGRIVARLSDVHKSYGDNAVYRGVELTVERGERVALVGVNGAGKSTLLKILAGALPFDRGERALGTHVEVHYYAQHQLDSLDPRRTILEELERADPDSTTGRLRNILGSFLFSGDAVDKRISVLSGGEKARVALAKMLVRPAALLCLDEPTNHLDLASKEVLEEALSTFTGTIVFISHDRYFINRIATRVVEVDRGMLATYLGGYDDYLAAKQTAAPPAPSPAPEPPRPTPAPVPARRAVEAAATPGQRRERKEIAREIKAIETRLRAVETQIHDLEARLEDIGLALADPALYRDGERAREIAQTRKETEERVAWLMKEWEDLSVQLASVKEDV